MNLREKVATQLDEATYDFWIAAANHGWIQQCEAHNTVLHLQGQLKEIKAFEEDIRSEYRR